MCSKSELQSILSETAVGLADIFGDCLENILLSIKLQNTESFYQYAYVLPFYKNVIKDE